MGARLGTKTKKAFLLYCERPCLNGKAITGLSVAFVKIR